MAQHDTARDAGVRQAAGTPGEPLPTTAAAAASAADYYLANEVGDLLMVEEPRLVLGDSRRWVFPVVLGNAIRGALGRVGSIAVDADTGEVVLDDEERERIEANAERLTRAAAS